MPLVDSLLTAVVRSDGDALVLHVGEKPYVVAAGGSVELSRQGLGLGAMEGMLAQLLSADALRALREMGAVEHELDDRPASSGDRFTVVAARGGDDIWIELRRHRRMRAAAAPASEPVLEAAAVIVPAAPVAVPMATVAVPLEPVSAAPEMHEAEAAIPAAEPELVHHAPPAEAPLAEVAVPVVADVVAGIPDEIAEEAEEEIVVAAAVELPAHAVAALPETLADPVSAVVAMAEAKPELTPPSAMSPVPMPEFAPLPGVSADGAALAPLEPLPSPPAVVEPALPAVPTPLPAAAGEYEPVFEEYLELAAPVAAARFDEVPVVPVDRAPVAVAPVAVAPAALPPAPPAAPTFAPAPMPVSAPAASAPVPAVEPRVAYRHEPTPAHAAPAMRHSLPPVARYEPPSPESVHYAPPEPQPTLPGLASSFGGDHAPDGGRLDSPDAIPAVVLSLTRDSARSSGGAARGTTRPGGIERLLRLAAARGASALYLTTQARPAVRVDGDIRLLDGEPALSSGDVEAAVLELAPEGARDKESAEWIRDLADVGRVRITTFRDYRGPGALLRMISARATSAEQLGLVREIQALATEPEGLVIVTGPRASGKSTMVSAFVDLINRQRNDYVITLEGQIRLVHESRGSLISQREVRGSAAEIVTAARTALRENPDVLVIEDLRSPDVLQAALDAAGSGLLVFVSVTAASATAALERLVDLCPSEQRRNVRAALAEHLRGVVAQVLLRKAGGGRLAARELVLNTNAVAALVSDGQIAQLPRAIDSGRKLGMAPLNDALVAFVQSGAVDVREAYRKADDKVGLLALLRREGIDTSFVERLA